MKTNRLHIILFVVLGLILTVGLSFAALKINQKQTKSKKPTQEKVMSIAIVNEDEGARHHEDHLVFGDAFIRSVEKDDSHNWYVVSRGVAESGLEKDLYQMMIVIPSHFTEKATAIHEVSPESVALYYKINSSKGEEDTLQAEKVAEEVLNDFNRRVIDVYFSSILTNLQQAQNHVGSIIDLEEQYVTNYQNLVHSPLDEFTNQFTTIKDTTELSREQYSGIEELLISMDEELGTAAENRKNQQQILSDTFSLSHHNNPLYHELFNQIDTLGTSLESDPIQQLEQLAKVNEQVANRFKKDDEQQSVVMLDHSYQIADLLSRQERQVAAFDEELSKKLDGDLKEQIERDLANYFEDSFENGGLNLSMFFENPDKEMRKRIEKQIARLPKLTVQEIDSSILPTDTKERLKQLIVVTNAYNDEFDYEPETSQQTPGLLIDNEIDAYREELINQGIEVKDEMEVKASENGSQTLSLEIPKGFHAERIYVELPNGERIRMNEADQPLELNAEEEGQIKISLQLYLDEDNKDFDIFSHAMIVTKLEENLTETIETEEIEATTEENSEEECEELSQDEARSSEILEELENETSHVNEPIQKQVVEKEIVVETNNQQKITKHQVMFSLIDEVPEKLIESSIETIDDFGQIQTLYELYFGFDFSAEDYQDKLEDESLHELATENAFYTLFNTQDIGELFKDYAVAQIVEQVTEQTDEMLSGYRADVAEFETVLDQLIQESDSLTNQLEMTREEAVELNRQVSVMIEEVARLREHSLEMLEHEPILKEAYEEEQEMNLQLNDGFQEFLLESEELAFTAETNRSSAEHIYQTFDLINEQADEIQDSGSNLLTDAEELSVNLTAKLMDDQEFANNFSEVFANSQIGDRPNEDLHQFLANPVETKNTGTVQTGNNEEKQPVLQNSPYKLVIISFVIALFTAYVIFNRFGVHEEQLGSLSKKEQILTNNTPLTIMISLFSIIQGMIIGGIVGTLGKVEISQTFIWITVGILILFSMTLVASYLLRQLNTLGMFLLLGVFSFYLLFREVALRESETSTLLEKIVRFSPLHYVETVYASLIRGNGSIGQILLVIGIVSIIGIGINLLVFYKRSDGEDDESEELQEAS